MRVKNRLMSNAGRFSGRKAEKFGMLAAVKNGLELENIEIARILGIGEKTMYEWFADDDYKEIERLYLDSIEEGDRLDVNEVKQLIA